jgi:hypothetical protein
MKKIISYGLVLAIVLFSACRKSDNPKLPEIARVPVPNLIPGTTGDQSISVSTPTSASEFSANFDITLKFPDDIPPSKMDLVVRKNGDNSTVKLLQAGITSWPVTINITGVQIITLFGPITLGDNYDFGVDVYAKDGKKYEAFPLVGIPYGSGVGGESGGVRTSIRYSAICKFNSADFVGSFKVVEDGWADYGVGDPIAVTVIDATHLSFFYGAPQGLPIIITVNPANNSTSVAKQVYGPVGYPPNWPYGPISCQSASTPGPDDYVAPCDGIVSIRLTHTVAAGSFGSYTIAFQKQ